MKNCTGQVAISVNVQFSVDCMTGMICHGKDPNALGPWKIADPRSASAVSMGKK